MHIYVFVALLLVSVVSNNSVYAKETFVAQSGVAKPVSFIKIAPTAISGSNSLRSAKINEHYSPVDIPCNGKVRGLMLSGRAQMQKVHQRGDAIVDGKKLHWECLFILSEGCALVTAEQKPILIQVGDSNVYMAKGSTAVLHYDRQVVRCANLSDHHLNSVKVVFGKYFRDVDPGREIILVRDGAGDIGKLALGESIGWRDLNRIKLGDVHVFTIKVSTKDMLKSCLIYRQLSESPLEADHRLKDELLKSAAALETMYNKKKGPFELSPYKQGHPGEEPSMQTAESGNSNQG